MIAGIIRLSLWARKHAPYQNQPNENQNDYDDHNPGATFFGCRRLYQRRDWHDRRLRRGRNLWLIGLCRGRRRLCGRDAVRIVWLHDILSLKILPYVYFYAKVGFDASVCSAHSKSPLIWAGFLCEAVDLSFVVELLAAQNGCCGNERQPECNQEGTDRVDILWCLDLGDNCSWSCSGASCRCVWQLSRKRDCLSRRCGRSNWSGRYGRWGWRRGRSWAA